MVRLAIQDNNKLNVSDVEFTLPQPNYTINTLDNLRETHPDTNFVLIMGEDNLRSLHKWKSYERILDDFDLFVYPRARTDGEAVSEKAPVIDLTRVSICEAPMIKISSTFLRNAIKTQKDIRYLVPDKVINYISNNYLYEK